MSGDGATADTATRGTGTDGGTTGQVVALWRKRAIRGVMDPSDRVTMVENHGILGDANAGRSKRQITVIEAEVSDQIRAELPDVDPAMRRANVMVRGIRLANARDRVLRIGEVRIRLLGETRPCERMDEACPGLMDALVPGLRAGSYCRVLSGGVVRLGDAVQVEPL
jgi:MOSC domain-containing protein YiiM